MPHIHEKIDFTVNVFVVHKNKVLLRKHEKYGIWLGVGGHVELDEDPNEAAIREVKEEVGLDIFLVHPLNFKDLDTKGHKELVPPLFMNIHSIDDSHKHIGMEYAAISENDKVVPENKDDKWKWLDLSEVKNDNDLDEKVKHYASEALRVASQKIT